MNRKRSIVRVRIPFEPTWFGPKAPPAMEGIAKAFIARNRWRVPHHMDYEDLLHESWIIFNRVKERYVTYRPQHFSTLFGTSLNNWFTDLAKARTRRPDDRQFPVLIDGSTKQLSIGGGIDWASTSDNENIGDAEIKYVLDRCAPELRELVELLKTDKGFERSDGMRETHLQRSCRLLSGYRGEVMSKHPRGAWWEFNSLPRSIK